MTEANAQPEAENDRRMIHDALVRVEKRIDEAATSARLWRALDILTAPFLPLSFLTISIAIGLLTTALAASAAVVFWSNLMGAAIALVIGGALLAFHMTLRAYFLGAPERMPSFIDAVNRSKTRIPFADLQAWAKTQGPEGKLIHASVSVLHYLVKWSVGAFIFAIVGALLLYIAVVAYYFWRDHVQVAAAITGIIGLASIGLGVYVAGRHRGRGTQRDP